jgi:CheY-like chemotaxis protein
VTSAPRVLAVDDHPVNLKLVRTLLVGEGFEVRTANNAEEARAAIPGFAPQVVLMDLQMPGMNGYELTRLLKADPATKDIVVLAMTAYAMKGDDALAAEAGCDGYITKPLDTRTLAKTILRYVGR